MESASSSSESDGNNEDIQSDSSGLLVKIVQNTSLQSPSAVSSDEVVDGACGQTIQENQALSSVGILPFVTSDHKSLSVRKLAATKLLQPFPAVDVDEKDLTQLSGLPPMKSCLPKKLASAAGRGATSGGASAPRRKTRKKNLSWKEPLAQGEPFSIKFRYFDFRRMSRTKARPKRRLKRRAKRPRSKSRSTSRPRHFVSRKRSKSRQPQEGTLPNRELKHARDQLNPTVRQTLIDETPTTSLSKDSHASVSLLESPAVSNLKKIDVNKMTIGGYKECFHQTDGWHKSTARKSQTMSSETKMSKLKKNKVSSEFKINL